MAGFFSRRGRTFRPGSSNAVNVALQESRRYHQEPPRPAAAAAACRRRRRTAAAASCRPHNLRPPPSSFKLNLVCRSWRQGLEDAPQVAVRAAQQRGTCCDGRLPTGAPSCRQTSALVRSATVPSTCSPHYYRQAATAVVRYAARSHHPRVRPTTRPSPHFESPHRPIIPALTTFNAHRSCCRCGRR